MTEIEVEQLFQTQLNTTSYKEMHSLMALSHDGEHLLIPYSDDLDSSTFRIIETRTGYEHSGRLSGRNPESSSDKCAIVLYTSSYLVSLDTEKGIVSVLTKRNDGYDSSSAFSLLGKKSGKVDNFCFYQQNDIWFLLFNSSRKLYIFNIHNGGCKELNFDLSAYEAHEKRSNLQSYSVVGMIAHPSKPTLFLIITLTNGNGFVLLYDFSLAITKLLSSDVNDEDNAETESVSETTSVANSAADPTQISRLGKDFDMIPRGIIKAPPPSSSYKSIKLCIHRSGNLLGIVWERENKILCFYEYRQKNSEQSAVRPLEPVSAAIPISPDFTVSAVAFGAQTPYLFLALKRLSKSAESYVTCVDYSLSTCPCLLTEEFLKLIPASNAFADVTITSLKVSERSNRVVLCAQSFSHMKSYMVICKCDLIQYPVLSTKVSIPPDAYVDGDDCIRIDSVENDRNQMTGQTNNAKMPFVLTLKKMNNLFKTDPYYDIYKSGIVIGMASDDSNKSQSPKTDSDSNCTFEGKLSCVIGEYDPHSSANWLPALPLDDRLSGEDYYFNPVDVKLNIRTIYGSKRFEQSTRNSNLIPYEFLLQGYACLSAAKPIDPSLSKSIPRVRCVCLVRRDGDSEHSLQSLGSSDNNQLRPLYSSFLDADFWTGPTSTSLAVSADNPSSLLALSSDGFSTKWVNLESNANSLLGEIKSIWRFDIEMRMMRVAPIGALNRTVFISNSIGQSSEVIYLSACGAPILETIPTTFTLQPGETVVEVEWQSIATAYGINAATSNQDKQLRQNVWRSASTHPFLGVLTTHRVFILNSMFEMMNCVKFRSNRSNQFDKAIVTSIYWVGNALIYCDQLGRLDYILPYLKLRHLTSSMPSSVCLSKLRLCGLTEDDFGSGKFCTIGMTENSMVRIVCCLPDRLVYAVNSFDSEFSYRIVLRTRPVFPGEIILLSMLMKDTGCKSDYIKSNIPSAFHSQARQALQEKLTPIDKLESKDTTTDSSLLTVLATVATNYYCRGSVSVTALDGSNVLTPCSHISNKLIIALTECGYAVIASIVCGMLQDTESTGYSTAGNFPNIRWVPGAIKFDVGLHSNRNTAGTLGLVYGNNRRNLYDRMLDNQSESSGLLLPYATDTMRLLNTASNIMMSTGRNEAAKKFNGLLSTSVSKDRTDESDIPLRNIYMNVNDKRRLSKIPSTIEEFQSKLVPVSEQESAIAKAKSTVDSINVRGQLGPPTRYPLFAMRIVDDWIGAKAKLEGVNHTSTFSNRVNSSTYSPVASSLSLPQGLTSQPQTWISDIGQGKELDKVVGYWRFSDVFYPSEQGFANTSLGTRLTFQDLSKYSSILCLELVIGQSSSDRIVSLEISSSNVDPGEDHEKVKALIDVVFGDELTSNNNTALTTTEMRILSGRGGPLDIGLFHVDHDRQHVTIEFMVFCGLAKGVGLFPIVLIERSLFNPLSTSESSNSSSKDSMFIYRLLVEEDGSIVFILNSGIIGNQSSSLSVKSEPLALFSSDSNGMNWTHLVFTLSTSDWSPTNMTTINIKVLINNQPVLSKTSPIIMGYKEPDIAFTLMTFFRNVPKDWRCTELRIWAASRSQDELSEYRDNHLGLASKRKRQQMRLKGTKDFFHPMKESLLGPIKGPRPSEIKLPTLTEKQTPESDTASKAALTTMGIKSGEEKLMLPIENNVSRDSSSDSTIHGNVAIPASVNTTAQMDTLATSTVMSKPSLLLAPTVGGRTRRSLARNKDANETGDGK